MGILLDWVFHDVHPAETNHAFEMIPPAVGLFHTFAEDAERDLVAVPYGIQFMSLFGAVEVNLAVVIHEVERHGVGIAAVASYGEHSAWRLLKQGDARLVSHLLFKPPHGAEWRFVFHKTRFSDR